MQATLIEKKQVLEKLDGTKVNQEPPRALVRISSGRVFYPAYIREGTNRHAFDTDKYWSVDQLTKAGIPYATKGGGRIRVPETPTHLSDEASGVVDFDLEREKKAAAVRDEIKSLRNQIFAAQVRLAGIYQ